MTAATEAAPAADGETEFTERFVKRKVTRM
jgi:hypothetical protein